MTPSKIRAQRDIDPDKVAARKGKSIDGVRAWTPDGMMTQRGDEVDVEMIDYGSIIADGLAEPVSVAAGRDALAEVRRITGLDSDAEASRRCIKIVADMLAGRVGA